MPIDRNIVAPRLGTTGRKSFPSLLLSFLLACQSYAALTHSSERDGATTAASMLLPQEEQIQSDRAKAVQKSKSIKRWRTRLTQSGKASWYGPGFHGKATASGEVFDPALMTAAHNTLPLGSKAKVINLANGNSVEVKINDRGPFVDGRIIDLSRAAARALGILASGVTQVRVEILTLPVG